MYDGDGAVGSDVDAEGGVLEPGGAGADVVWGRWQWVVRRQGEGTDAEGGVAGGGDGCADGEGELAAANVARRGTNIAVVDGTHGDAVAADDAGQDEARLVEHVEAAGNALRREVGSEV